jgi:hypothetical protein
MRIPMDYYGSSFLKVLTLKKPLMTCCHLLLISSIDILEKTLLLNLPLF